MEKVRIFILTTLIRIFLAISLLNMCTVAGTCLGRFEWRQLRDLSLLRHIEVIVRGLSLMTDCA